MSAAQNAYKTQAAKHQQDQLITSHLELVRHILGKLVAQLPPDVDEDNLQSAGLLGLVEAARKFDAKLGVNFRTFAYPRIRGAILDELRRNSPLPQKVIQHITRIRRASETLTPPICAEDLAHATGLELADVDVALEAMRLSKFQRWEDPSTMPHGVLDGRTERPDQAVMQAELREALADAILQLPEKERHVLTLYYMEDLRLKEIGDVLKLSESRISRILTDAKLRLQHLLGPQEDLL